ncbi:50S ribosomal protein L18 [Buchnera aphidicola]|uniref:Large ribosomal subunit protein uL18 n=2 Tax=Buchnera aphidicola (Cinara cedri) TaxID=261318 RepID=Q057C0_BUCCC|nr:50S ribosomal protein L18 [Buchnera aphidicola]AAW72691.1 50S ribosomal protein L18 [Buchnera aphidicola (Cinara cedri)]ABJ90779.1 50S ribosomal protein L18 [Buchnera aphidicola BCc]
MKGYVNKKKTRIRRYTKIRKKIRSNRDFRLVIHRTSKHIYAQIISCKTSFVLVCASTLEFRKLNINNIYTGNKISAKIIGKLIAERALIKGIKKVFFDRSGFKYHGRIEELAKSARVSGLIF